MSDQVPDRAFWSPEDPRWRTATGQEQAELRATLRRAGCRGMPNGEGYLWRLPGDDGEIVTEAEAIEWWKKQTTSNVRDEEIPF